MMYESLVEEITRLVMAEIGKMQENSAASSTNPDRAKVLVVLDDEAENLSQVFDTLGKVSGELPDYHIYIPEHLSDMVRNSAGFLRYTPIDSLKRHQFKGLVERMDRVVIPFLSITSLSKIVEMVGDEPVSGCCLRALMAGKPVSVCTDGIHALTYTGIKTESKLMSIIRSNLKILEEMGAETVQINKLKENIGVKPAEPAQPTVGMKNVVTQGDVTIAFNQGHKTLNFPRGTIVTPLARETATNLGMEINLV